MSRRTFIVGIATLTALVTLLSGCFFERLSWSPDGRYLVFSDEKDGKLWRWDSRTERTEEIKLEQTHRRSIGSGRTLAEDKPVGKKVLSCRYSPAGDRIILLIGDDDDGDLYYLNLEDSLCYPITKDVEIGFNFDISPDGKNIYYFQEGEEDRIDLMQYSEGTSISILSTRSDVAFLRVSPDNKRIAYSVGQEIRLLNLESGTTQTALSVENREADGGFYHPTWIDNNRLIYYECFEGEGYDNELIGTMRLLSLKNGATRTLCKDAHIFYPPSVDPKGGRVAVTMALRNAEGEFDENTPGGLQIAAVDIASGKVDLLTDEPWMAVSGAFSPDGKRLAYISLIAGNENMELFQILDLETNRRTIAWRDEAEQLLATADKLEQIGDDAQALALFQKLVADHPESELKGFAQYRQMLLYLKPQLLDIDRAFAIALEFGGGGAMELNEFPKTTRELFWGPEQQLATDPAEDWITRYGTEASKHEFKFDTDLPRDLRGLSTRWGKERLYVRIDTGGYDFGGIRFQDILLLFDYDDTPDQGLRAVSPTAKWDRGAERQVLVRHWYEPGKQYDLEVRDGQNEVVCRFLGSGFSPPGNPLFGLVQIDQGDRNAVVYSISRKMLGLEKARDVVLQVCTFKGGIETHAGMEKPRAISIDGKPVCDVADAFGEENNAERIAKDLKDSQALPKVNPEEGETPCPSIVIKGYAAKFRITD